MFNKIFYVLTAIIALVLVVLLVRAFMNAANQGTEPSDEEYTFPIDDEMPDAGAGRIFVPTEDGNAIEVNDIRSQDGIHTIGSGNYVTGSLEETTAPLYQLVFFEVDRSYLISLEAKPLAAARRQGENDLLARLGVSETVACSLKIRVSTARDIDPALAGTELGLSFCPGAISLE